MPVHDLVIFKAHVKAVLKRHASPFAKRRVSRAVAGCVDCYKDGLPPAEAAARIMAGWPSRAFAKC